MPLHWCNEAAKCPETEGFAKARKPRARGPPRLTGGPRDSRSGVEQGSAQLPGVDGLDEVGVEARVEAPLPVASAAVPGEGDQPHAVTPRLGANLAGQGVPVDAG